MDDGTKKGLIIGCGVLGVVGTCCIGIGGVGWYQFRRAADQAQASMEEEARQREDMQRQEEEARQRAEEAHRQAQEEAESQQAITTPPPSLGISPTRVRDRRTRHINARITQALGGSGLNVGDTCEFDVTVERTRNDVGYWCRAKIECGGRRLFGVDRPRSNGFFNCELFDNPLGVAGEDLTPTRGQEDAAMQIDTRQNRLIVFDDATGLMGAEYRIEAEIVSVN